MTEAGQGASGPADAGPGPGGGRRLLRELLERAEAIGLDPALPAARSWKERSGGPVIGFMPIYVPREILHAQGVLPVGIVGGGGIEIIRGDACYQSYICHIPRSTVELALNGSLDVLDGMLFPSICDVIRNLSGMWRMLLPGKFARYLDLPQDFDPRFGGAFYRHELESLARDLETLGARPLRADALRSSLAVYNENRRLVRDLYALRGSQPWKVPTCELYLVLRAGLAMPVEEHTEMLRDYRDLALEEPDRRPRDQARVVLTGSFCEQPPLALIRTLERAGCYIVDDDLVAVHRYLRSDVPTGGDPLDALVRAFLADVVPGPTRYVAGEEKGRDLVDRVRASGAEGVIFCAPSFCDPALLDQPMAARAVDRAGIPWTAFKYSENSGQFQVIREQAGTFADAIKLWEGA